MPLTFYRRTPAQRPRNPRPDEFHGNRAFSADLSRAHAIMTKRTGVEREMNASAFAHSATSRAISPKNVARIRIPLDQSELDRSIGRYRDVQSILSFPTRLCLE